MKKIVNSKKLQVLMITLVEIAMLKSGGKGGVPPCKNLNPPHIKTPPSLYDELWKVTHYFQKKARNMQNHFLTLL